MQMNEDEIIDLTPKDEDSISMKYEPKLFDNLNFYLSGYFLFKVLPTIIFIFVALIGFLVMFTVGLPMSKTVVWSALFILIAFVAFIKPTIDFIRIKIKAEDKNSCEFFGDKEKIIVKTPINKKIFRYEFLKQIVETKQGMIFKFGQIRHFYLPKRVYKDNPDFAKYYKILEKNYIV